MLRGLFMVHDILAIHLFLEKEFQPLFSHFFQFEHISLIS